MSSPVTIEYPPAHSVTPLTKTALEKILNVRVSAFPGLYIQAFTHRSASRETGVPSLERLEFLGDAVISFVVAKYAFDSFPDKDEGFLTRIRTKLTCSATLANLARVIGLQDYIIMNGMSMAAGWNKNDKTLEDALEAVVGALYMDRGLVIAKAFFLHLVETYVDKKDLLENNNYKDLLMKWAQSKGQPPPEYVSKRVSAASHGKLVFDTTVTILGKTGRAVDACKKKSEMKSARALMVEHGVKFA